MSDLKVSIPNGPYASRMRQWEEDIPGSKLVIVPFELNSPKNWYKRVYINMGIYSMISLVFLFGLCVILVMVIYFYFSNQRSLILTLSFRQFTFCIAENVKKTVKITWSIKSIGYRENHVVFLLL